MKIVINLLLAVCLVGSIMGVVLAYDVLHALDGASQRQIPGKSVATK